MERIDLQAAEKFIGLVKPRGLPPRLPKPDEEYRECSWARSSRRAYVGIFRLADDTVVANIQTYDGRSWWVRGLYAAIRAALSPVVPVSP